MTRFGSFRRRAARGSSPHDRARLLSAERLDGPLASDDAAWLDAHLAGCEACRAVAASYIDDRAALRGLRDQPIEAPRDLWARTAAGIERERARNGGPLPDPAAGGARRTARDWRVPVGALSGLAVVMVVVAVAGLAGGWGLGSTPIRTDDSALGGLPSVPPSIAVATPILVKAGAVGWVHLTADGAYAYNRADVREVCPIADRPGCAALDDSAAKALAIRNTPKAVIGSPTEHKAVVVASDATGHDQVIVVALPHDDGATSSPTPLPTATASSAHTASPTIAPTASATPSPTPSDTASVGPGDSPTPTPTSTPSLTPAPTVAAGLAIASGVTVVGDSAAFSADGSWFAFTARPVDTAGGSLGGPDIYVWHVGDAAARRLTTDGRSAFASWLGDLVVGSRPIGDAVVGLSLDPSASASTSPDPSAAPTDSAAASSGSPDASAPITLDVTSFVIDPSTDQETGDAAPLWRPVLDPTGRFAVGWSGTVSADAPGGSEARYLPAVGALVLTSWQPSVASPATKSRLTADGAAVQDFDVRWDETGTWFAVWIADGPDGSVGRLTLYHVDGATGTIQPMTGAPTDVPAMPGFSIGNGRLAWVTPDGQDAQGSRVQVAAWSATGVGVSESVPGEDVLVVR